MAKTFTKKDLKLLGYTVVEKMQTEEGIPWDVYEAMIEAGAGTTTDNFLYFPSATDVEHIKICAGDQKYNDYYVIALPSRVKTVQKHFENSKGVFTVDGLVKPKLKQKFEKYTKKIRKYTGDRRPKNYISSALNDIILNNLKPNSNNNKDNKKPIHIIAADAATGKTTLARNIAFEVIEKKYDFVPIYVEISQIESLDNYNDFWMLIKSQLEGDVFLDESLFKYSLEQGYFIFIFDGFDELCTKRYSNFKANQLLEWFIDIVEVGTECQIVITTRKSFWQSEINTAPLGEYIKEHNLEPFNKDQAREYFNKFFDDDSAKVSRATNIYTDLLEDNYGNEIPFIKLPSSIDLIADSVKNNVRNITQFTNEKPAITQFLLFMLNREGRRHQLLTTPELQLSAFEEIAVDYFPCESFEIEDLLCVGFNESENIESLKNHPFIESDAVHADTYKFRFVLLELYFISLYLQSEFKNLVNNKRKPQKVLKIIKYEAKGEGSLLDVFVSNLPNEDFNFKAMHKNAPNEIKSFLFHAARKQINGNINENGTINFFDNLVDTNIKTEATANCITGLYIIGDIVGMNFRNTILQDCTFKNINFKNCRGTNTKFKNCKFIGSLGFDDDSDNDNKEQFKKKWRDIREENCEFDTLSGDAWNNLPNITGTLSDNDKKKIIEKIFKAILKQFLNNGHIRDVSINKFRNGVLGMSIYTKYIIEIMVHEGFIVKGQEQTGNRPLYKIHRDKRECMHKFNDEGSITEYLKVLHKEALKLYKKAIS